MIQRLRAHSAQDYITQVLKGLMDMHKRGITQKRKLPMLEDNFEPRVQRSTSTVSYFVGARNQEPVSSS